MQNSSAFEYNLPKGGSTSESKHDARDGKTKKWSKEECLKGTFSSGDAVGESHGGVTGESGEVCSGG